MRLWADHLLETLSQSLLADVVLFSRKTTVGSRGVSG